MNLKEELLRGIYAYGFEKPSAIQQRAIIPCVKGHDVIAQAQSGLSIFISDKWYVRKQFYFKGVPVPVVLIRNSVVQMISALEVVGSSLGSTGSIYHIILC